MSNLITNIPREILCMIFDRCLYYDDYDFDVGKYEILEYNLNNKTLISLGKVCKLWKTVVYNNMFKYIFFPNNVDPQTISRFGSKKIYAPFDKTIKFRTIRLYNLEHICLNPHRPDILDIFQYCENVELLDIGCHEDYVIGNGIKVTDRHLINLRNIKYIFMNYNNIVGTSFINFISLKQLSLRFGGDDEITDANLQLLKNLEYLEIRGQLITNEGLKNLRNCRVLKMSENNLITSEGLKYLPKIQWIYFHENHNMDDEALKYISNIETIEFSNHNNKITDSGLKYIGRIKYLSLQFNYNITNNGLKNLPSLTYLNLENNYNVNLQALKFLPLMSIDDTNYRFHYGCDGCDK